jgi:hypothetical protein
MDAELLKQARQELARQGGLARAKKLNAKQRKASAIKASKAAARARTRRARAQKKHTDGGQGPGLPSLKATES